MSKQLSFTLITAALASLLFFLGTSLGFLFMFLPTLPLFSAGLGKSPKVALEAAAIATLPIALLTSSISAPAIFMLVYALPCVLISHLLLLHRDIQLGDGMPTLRFWYPAGLVIISLAVYACVMLAITTALFATQETNLPNLLAQTISEEIKTIQKDMGITLEQVSPSYIAFMLCGFLAWLWTIVIYAHAWAANSSLARKKIAPRPSIAIHPFPMPNWLLSLMGICALASLIGGESMQFLGKASFIILLLPYFFQGAAILHLTTLKWQNRWLLLGAIYLSIVALFWPAFILAGVGLWQHAKILNKHLSIGGNSSTS